MNDFDEIFTEEFSKMIKEERKKRNMTQTELAKDICAVSVISDIENGNNKRSSFEIVMKLLERFDISIYEFMKIKSLPNNNLNTENIKKALHLMTEYRFNEARNLIGKMECSQKLDLIILLDCCESFIKNEYDEVLFRIENKISKIFLNSKKSIFNNNDLVNLYFYDIYFRSQMIKNISIDIVPDGVYIYRINNYKNYLLENVSFFPNEITKLIIYSTNYFRHIKNFEIILSLINHCEKLIKIYLLDNLYPAFFIAKIISFFTFCKYNEAADYAKNTIILLLSQNKQERIIPLVALINDLIKRSEEFKKCLDEIKFSSVLINKKAMLQK